MGVFRRQHLIPKFSPGCNIDYFEFGPPTNFRLDVIVNKVTGGYKSTVLAKVCH